MNNRTSFLRAIAIAFIRNACIKGDELSSYTFVFPNRRSSRFFQKFLGEEYGHKFNKPLFTPSINTISELFVKISGLQTANALEALYLLYEEYIALKYPDLSREEVEKKESFDEFYNWGNLIIADYNDIDTYLVDSAKIFANIRDLKELDDDYSYYSERQKEAVKMFWNVFLHGEKSEKKENFGSLWNIMNELYLAFNKRLFERGLGYSGRIYRKVAEEILNNGFDNVVDEKIYGTLVFIGFNAPNKCEQTLMRSAQKAFRADFYWDFYGDMIRDKENKSSCFISDFVKDFKSEYDISDEVECKDTDKSFEAIGVASGVGQAYAAGNILKNLYKAHFKDIQEPTLEQINDLALSTAIVLPDETLLMPMIDSIPKEFKNINITMGYPMRITPLFSFINYLCDMQKEMKTEENGEECGGKVFYHRTVTNLLSHEYFKKIAKEECSMIKQNIIKSNIIFIKEDSELISNIRSGFLKKIFKAAASVDDLINYLTDILKELEKYVDIYEKEFIFRYYTMINKLGSLKIPISKQIFYKIIYSAASDITIPFNGEPLSGLQVMGPLETRSLDFDNVIILSCNDGVFPSANMPQSLIPYNLRYGFGLPTYETSDAIGAYHFYRNIYRAKNVFMIYDTRSQGLASGEMSRYILQLKYHYNVDMHESIFVTALKESADSYCSENDRKIEKTPEIIEKLRRKYIDTSSLSASALNCYRQCPLKFYLTYIEGVKQEEEVKEYLESDTFGSIFHKVMEDLYGRYKDKTIDKEDIKLMKDENLLDGLIGQAFSEIMKIPEITGQNIVTKEVLKKYIRLTLDIDSARTPFTYLQGELKLYSYVEINDGCKVRMISIIDRVDSKDGTVRISDYKTGSFDAPNSKFEISKMFDKNEKNLYPAVFQLFFYSLFFARKNNIDNDFVFCVYPLKKMFKDSIYERTVLQDELTEFENCMHDLIEEIFNPDIPFTSSPDERACSYCDFANICRK